MRKVLFICAIVLTSSFAFSQTAIEGEKYPNRRNMKCDKGDREERHKEFKDKMAKDLNLTESQIKQINSIDDKYKSQEETLKTQGENLREQKQQLREQKRAEVEKVLTNDQKEKLKGMKDKFHERRIKGNKDS